ncbi:MAG: sigma-54 interaction domain-containing protein [Pirellulaceae bacterium]
MAEMEPQNLEGEQRRLSTALQELYRPDYMIGNSGAMRAVYQRIYQVATSDTPLLVRGESGTGKELVAAAVHGASRRVNGPFVKVHCAALHEWLLESELFGHEKGAFTGALASRPGRLEEAKGGTLFLDEIGDLSPTTQVRLLRALQECEYERVGSHRTLQSNVRIIMATSKDLERAVHSGAFREDLYDRLHRFAICLPPLRERKDDILLLADRFAACYARKAGKEVRRISATAINMLFDYHWPGNVRELENCIEQAVLLAADGVIRGHHLPLALQMPERGELATAASLTDRVELFEKDLIVDALQATRGNVAAAARRLGITPRIIRYKIRKLRIGRSV